MSAANSCDIYYVNAFYDIYSVSFYTFDLLVCHCWEQRAAELHGNWKTKHNYAGPLLVSMTQIQQLAYIKLHKEQHQSHIIKKEMQS